MKLTITGFMNEISMHDVQLPAGFSRIKTPAYTVPVTITYDECKPPKTKTVWEWMVRSRSGQWSIEPILHSEQSAAEIWPNCERKKLRSFEVECDE